MTRFPKVTRVEIGNEIGSTSIIHYECFTCEKQSRNELDGIPLNLKIENEKLEDTIDKLKTEIESKETQLTEGIKKEKEKKNYKQLNYHMSMLEHLIKTVTLA